MALKQASETSNDSGRAAPGWVFPLYAGGMTLVFLGERVLSGLEKGRGAATALGVLCVVAATGLRFSPRFKTGGERKSIEAVLAVLSATGLVALAIYFATTDAGVDKLGLASMAVTKKEHLLGVLRVLWIALAAVSLIPMLFAETALWPMRRAERPESRRVRAAASAGLTLVLAAIYGSLLVYAAGGVPWKADYSYFKTSRPSESTRKIAASLAEPVKVVAFFPDVNEVRNEVSSYLKELATGMPKLQVQVSDRLLSPKLAKELRATQDGVIVFSRGSVNYTVNVGTELEAARPKLKTLDKDVKEQLLKLARARLTAYMTVGHGELNDAGKGKEDPSRSASIARQLLQKQNLTLKDLGLAQGLGSEVPDDADVVLVLGPSEPFASEEIGALQRYADRGGHLFIAFEPDANTAQISAPHDGATPPEPTPVGSAAPATSASSKKPPPAPEKPSATEAPETAPAWATALANIAQLTYTPTVLANDHAHVRLSFNNADQVRLISNSFSSHASVSTLSRNSSQAAVVFFGTGSLERGSNATAKIDFAVRAPSGTFPDRNKNYVQEKDSEKSGSFNVAAAVSRPIAGAVPADADKDKKPGDKKPESKEMRAFVVADSDAFGDLVMSNVRGNQVFMADAVRWLVGEASFAGAETSEEDVRIESTKQQDLSWFYATIFGAPCLVMAAGVVISRRSRRVVGAKR
ncbi:MAG TPA: Gldg family protein [Polyangiaceae bacterium]|nr:Gldg family protein [Polyangiaceae bacterium]